MITLYDYELSGNCYKIRLMLNLLKLAYSISAVEFYPGAEHKQDWFLRINPLGQLPVLTEDEFTVRDSQAILVYLASRYDSTGNWYPASIPHLLAEMQMWLSFADGLTSSISAARLHDLFFYQLDAPAARTRAHQLLRVLDDRLWEQELDGFSFLCRAQHPTIADIACFPYVALSDQGAISLADYPAVRRWLDRVKRIPGFVVMSGIFPASGEHA